MGYSQFRQFSAIFIFFFFLANCAGSFAVVSIMTGDAADKVIEEITKDQQLTEEEETEARIQAVTSLAFMVGVIQV